ncbi:hypothetical protein MSG28_000622 [Choristoneura fumiferana]|uniref:Uncharacterized protein n=1 Tax=Choristoneura fumiferana TaxID=7141 RepID=A0ACC0K1T3_CHOFU|nr:hypothetical protein MSG28_000622 [Choristoneura fumiferana]
MGALIFLCSITLHMATSIPCIRMSDHLPNALNNLRELMLTGSDGVPILDPLEIEHLHVDEDFVGIPGARLTINQLLVKYASTFIVDRLSISLTSLIFQRYSVEFEAHLPILEAETGEYDLFIPVLDLNIFGKGDGKNYRGIGRTLPDLLLALEVFVIILKKILLHFFSALNGLFNHDGASDFANSFLSHLVPELLDFYEEDISAFLSPLIQDIANEALRDVSIGDLLYIYMS